MTTITGTRKEGCWFCRQFRGGFIKVDIFVSIFQILWILDMRKRCYSQGKSNTPQKKNSLKSNEHLEVTNFWNLCLEKNRREHTSKLPWGVMTKKTMRPIDSFPFMNMKCVDNCLLKDFHSDLVTPDKCKIIQNIKHHRFFRVNKTHCKRWEETSMLF